MEPLPPASKLRLAAEILITYVQVRWRLWREPLPPTVAALRSPSALPQWSRRPPLADVAGQGERLGDAVVRTLGVLPFDSRCLICSLVLLRLLVRREGDGSLVIAVLPSAEPTLIAHAWIELEGRPLLAPATADYGRLLTL